jgi:hypothetical protein
MFRAWKDTILSHYSLISGKGVKEQETQVFLMISAIPTLSLFRAPCNLAEGPPLGNFGPSNKGGLGLLS